MNGEARVGGRAGTSRDARDRKLRGRTFAVPFEQVWQASLRLTGAGLRGWTLQAADDHAGEILAVSRGLFGAEHDIAVYITLDADGQTRVDAVAAARKPRFDFGRSARRLKRFFRALDRALERLPRRGLVTRS